MDLVQKIKQEYMTSALRLTHSKEKVDEYIEQNYAKEFKDDIQAVVLRDQMNALKQERLQQVRQHFDEFYEGSAPLEEQLLYARHKAGEVGNKFTSPELLEFQESLQAAEERLSSPPTEEEHVENIKLESLQHLVADLEQNPDGSKFADNYFSIFKNTNERRPASMTQALEQAKSEKLPASADRSFLDKVISQSELSQASQLLEGGTMEKVLGKRSRVPMNE